MKSTKFIFTTLNLSKEFLESIFTLASKIEQNLENYSDKCKGKILATLFFEPSTRTMLSFESAMLRLGGSILGFSSAKTSSLAKGETIADTLRMINGYADIAVIRHFLEGVGEIAKKYSSIPVISGGTGTQAHPTQAMLDLYTIKNAFGTIDGLKVALMGDLKYGRTIPSLLYGLAKYENVTVYLVSPKELKIRNHVRQRLKDFNLKFYEIDDVSQIIDELDVLYVTRIQKERFPDQLDYERLKSSYKISPSTLKDTKKSFILLHPLPRVDEITPEVDDLGCAKYFEQAKNGVYVRMAIILKLLGVE
ncbi:MAG: aspartate carbamoyltransferase [Candidatus Heimdallarchaeum endolithica]|uniref:Aspartate carbamoyltransferase n=1 Tax=Candidatus Heimdallarchaeum endolithica TaxID=2876572 RepID=A0A9Y1BQI1_9ARCH|nr:MAG: aspartate carbamoyltransferase [Candidatus Heimdallarchaeum endolithica]